DLTEGLPESAAVTLERLDNNVPVDPVAAEEASDALYAKYKELQAMKSDPNRVHTIEEIDTVMQPLGVDIERLERYTTESDTARIKEVSMEVSEAPQESAETTETVTEVEEPTQEIEAVTETETVPTTDTDSSPETSPVREDVPADTQTPAQDEISAPVEDTAATELRTPQDGDTVSLP